MKLNYKIIDKGVSKKLKRYEKDLPDYLLTGIKRAVRVLDSDLQGSLYSGKYNIRQRHGQAGLAGSFDTKYLKSKNRVQAIYGSKLIYALIQEEGGTIKVTPRMAGFAWHKYVQTSETMWMAIALRKGQTIKIPAHWYLKKSFKGVKDRMGDVIQRTIKQEIK